MPYEIKVFASLPQVERGVSKIIGGDPKGNNFLYTNGKCVILRNIDNPALANIYTEHAHQVVVAKYSPSGFYIASADVSGKLRIWDTMQKEHLLKYEYQPFAGKIKDIAWTEDSKRIAVVGEGREKFGAVFLGDSGSSVGEITGHKKVINSVDIKQSRPYRLATGSDDNCAAFFEGPPFKFKFTIGTTAYAIYATIHKQKWAHGFGAVFLWDSGSSVGEITGHKKVINSVDIKQSRPYRLATGSDDNCAAFFEGPPGPCPSMIKDFTHSPAQECWVEMSAQLSQLHGGYHRVSRSLCGTHNHGPCLGEMKRAVAWHKASWLCHPRVSCASGPCRKQGDSDHPMLHPQLQGGCQRQQWPSTCSGIMCSLNCPFGGRTGRVLRDPTPAQKCLLRC
ncbi:hypothetical protein P7K49_026707 [Saguinus oedipus]|uniref:WD repeat-containing protein 1 n=1 Tax=Saguinus oedipus TaxID=9490 RepID=A0ABQ9UE20_SAGOE|nr:hypothetical protein P7K49_026707 [Saguinus oedipus]